MSYKRFLAFADNHGSLVCDEALNKLKSFADDWKPHYRIHLGDNWDFSPLRRGASQEEKAEGISEDYKQGMRFIDIMRPNILTLGNHDDRIWDYAVTCADGLLRERCQDLVKHSEKEFARRKITWIPYVVDKYLQMPEGGPYLSHGFGGSSQYPAAKVHRDNGGGSLFGHWHTADIYNAKDLKQDKSYAVPTMADINQMFYADRHVARRGWRSGFLYGLIHTKTGEWHAWHVLKQDGVWISPQGIL